MKVPLQFTSVVEQIVLVNDPMEEDGDADVAEGLRSFSTGLCKACLKRCGFVLVKTMMKILGKA